ncbi:RNA methyltransferase [Flavobacterium sp. HSC-61S13]|uniref:RNA methyltransferase n=1 Tax=Flavobacterium sp. HSC-61S13 TaxID=2910963 RepID=UPI00209FAD56|nr:RNA methyltransferase [Flavobacterium sp. HSC-61S13]
MRKLANSELNRINPDEFKDATKSPLILVLDDIRSLHNIGSVFRTSDAFLIEKIYLCGITATPPNKEIHKTALGATETVAWEYATDVVEVLEKLKAEGVSLQAVEQVVHSVMLNDFKIIPEQKYALVFGNEVKGVSQKAIDYCDGVIEIPQLGTKHSLNISVSAGIVVWDLFQKINASSSSAE